jgi:hypothetical protein
MKKRKQLLGSGTVNSNQHATIEELSEGVSERVRAIRVIPQ